MSEDRRRLVGGLWFGLLCAAAIFAPWLGGQLSGVGPAAARALACGAGLAWIADRWGRWTMPRPAAWLWAFAAWSAITALQGNNVNASLVAVSNLISWAALAALAADAAREPKRRAALMACLLLGLAAVGGAGAWDGLTNVPGWRVFGPFATPNLFAAYLITILPLAAFGTASAGRFGEAGARFWWSAASLFAGLAALMLTASKGAVAALGAGVLIASALALYWRRVRLMGVAAVVVLGIVAALAFGNTLLGRVGASTTAEAHSGQFRVLTWRATANMAERNPVVGVGAGAFGSTFNKYAIAGWTQAAHNAYLQTAAETGFPGLLLFLGALGSSALWLYRAARTEDAATAMLGAAGLAGLLAAAAHNLVDYGWTAWAPSAALWMVVGLGVGSLDRAQQPVSRAVAAAMAVPLALALIFGILTANAAAIAEPATDPTAELTPQERVAALRSARSLNPLDADLARQLGIALARAGEHRAALAPLKEAALLAPGEPTAWRYLGEANRVAGHPDEARLAFAEGLKFAPNSYKLLLDAAEFAETEGRSNDALSLYRRIIQAHEGPAGQYPATPELVPLEPIIAYAALAREADRTGDRRAARDLRRALLELANRYEANREKYSLIWQATGQDDPASLVAVRALAEEARERLGSR